MWGGRNMSEKRFSLWRTEDIDGHTDEWAVIDNTILDKEEGHIDEQEVVDLLNHQQFQLEMQQAMIRKLNKNIDIILHMNEDELEEMRNWHLMLNSNNMI